MNEEDEAFNEIERQAKQRKEAVRAAINKPAPTYFTDQHAISMKLRDYFAARAMAICPLRAWVDLTDDEYFALQMKIKAPMISVQDYIDAMRMVEAKLKDKNT